MNLFYQDVHFGKPGRTKEILKVPEEEIGFCLFYSFTDL